MWAELIPGQLDIATWLLMRTHLLPILIRAAQAVYKAVIEQGRDPYLASGTHSTLLSAEMLPGYHSASVWRQL